MPIKFPTIKLPTFGKQEPAKSKFDNLDTQALQALSDDYATTTIIADSAAALDANTVQQNTVSELNTVTSPTRRVRKKSWQIPVIGKLSLSTQTQILGTVIGASLALAFFLMWMDTRTTAEQARNVSRVDNALLQSQRIAKEIQGAAAGRPEAFERIRSSATLVDTSFNELNGRAGQSGVSDELLTKLQKAEAVWRRLQADSAQVSGGESLLLNVGLAKAQFDVANRRIIEAIEKIAESRMKKGATAAEIAAYKQMNLMAQRLNGHVNDLTSPTSTSVAADISIKDEVRNFTQYLGKLAEGADGIPVQAGSPEEFKVLLTQEANKLKAINMMVDSAGKLLIVKGSVQNSAEQAEDLLLALGEIKTELTRPNSTHAWLLGMSLAFIALAILGSLALSKAYVDDGHRQADEAEAQRAEAERLEQEAKRTNDQNQAAILRLMNELQEVADGDLTVQVSVSEDITGAIADSVNYTVEELRSLVARINMTATAVGDAATKAQQISSGLLAASEQQSREIRETGESVLRLADSIHRVSANALESAKVARQSLQAAEQGAGAVHRTISGMSDIRDQIQETAKRIKRLGESSQEIGEIVELISDITEQTNVLALNAAIQAASAGEAGRGFSVVAEEVQRLAERSGEATKQIAALIKTIQSDTQDAVSAMERSTQNVVEGAKLSDAAGQALGEIGTVSRQLAELIESISVTTNREAASAGTVAQSIQRILLVTEQTSEGTQQTASSVGQLTELAADLRNSVTRFKVA